jgi:hypothetical protein
MTRQKQPFFMITGMVCFLIDLRRFLISGFFIGILPIVFASCSRNTQAPPGPSIPHISYELSIPSVDTVHVLATFSYASVPGATKLLFPPFDADNPAITLRGNNIQNLRLTNATISEPLAVRDWLGDSVQSLMVTALSDSFSIDYDATFPYDPNGNLGFRTVLPGRFGAADGYFQGNYVFCVPAYAATKSAWWRGGLDAQVSLALPSAGNVHGIPTQPFTCSTIYELFFLQWAISDNVVSCGSSSSSIVTLSAAPLLPDMPSLVCADIARADSICAPFFPALFAPRTVILEDSGSGMEGTFSFYMINWQGNDYASSVRAITMHEALHAWIGIRTGDLDDPWWKEGTASYLGRVLAANIGFPKDSLRPQIVKSLAGSFRTSATALSDPYVRDHLYDKDTGASCLVLVYDKGAQACMLLDKMIRQATGNASSLFQRSGALCTQYDHTAFSRAEFKQVLEEGSGLDLSGFFNSYIDRPGVIDTAELSVAWHYLDSCGAFSGKP